MRRRESNTDSAGEASGRRVTTVGSDELTPAGAEDGLVEDADFDGYLDLLAALDMPLPMKIELIRALRGIMQNFVDRAFGDDPVQLSAGSNINRSKIRAAAHDEMLGLPDTKTNNKNDRLTSKAQKAFSTRKGRTTDT